MSKRHRRDTQAAPTSWETERTLEAAEADVPDSHDAVVPTPAQGDGRCVCGSNELLLQAYYAVTDGNVASEPLEVDGLTCPECNREFEAIVLEDGRIVRGELVGFADLDDTDA